MQKTIVSTDCPFDANGQQMGAGIPSRVIFYIFVVLTAIQMITVVLNQKLLQDGEGVVVVGVICGFLGLAFFVWHYHLQKCRPWTGFGLYIAIVVLMYGVMWIFILKLILNRVSFEPEIDNGPKDAAEP